MLATPIENTSPSKRRLKLIGVWIAVFLLSQFLLIYLLLQDGWHSLGQGIFYCCGVSRWYEKEGLVAIVDFREAAEVNVSVSWGLSPTDTTTRIAAGLDVLIMLSLLALWRARVKRL